MLDAVPVLRRRRRWHRPRRHRPPRRHRRAAADRGAGDHTRRRHAPTTTGRHDRDADHDRGTHHRLSDRFRLRRSCSPPMLSVIQRALRRRSLGRSTTTARHRWRSSTSTEPVTLEPSVIPANSLALATEVIDGPETDQQVTSTVTIDLGDGVETELSDDIVAPACTGPEVPPDVSFTFTKTASVAEAVVGDTVEYTYCGQNTSTIPLEVVRVVDDRLGVVIEDPAAVTVVEPGESVCNTDLGFPASYVVQATDTGSFIDNNAVVTVRTQETKPREFQATASSSVGVRDVAENVAPCVMLDVKVELSADEQLPTWTYNAPPGKLITGYCYKYSTTIVGPQPLDPPAPSVTFSSGGADNISHFTVDLVSADGTDVTSETEECPAAPSSVETVPPTPQLDAATYDVTVVALCVDLAPEGLTATPGDTIVTLRWSPPTSDGGSPITGYVVEESFDGATTWATVSDGDDTDTKATINGLKNGTLYYFRILAVNDNGAGAPSVDVEVTPLAPTYGVSVSAVCVDLTPFVDVESTGTGDIRVSVGPESMVLTADQPTGQLPWPTVDGSTPDTSAKWDAVRLDTMEPFDNGVLTLPAECPPPPIVPSAPEGLTATPGNATVTLQWSPPTSDGGSPITDYIVEQSPDGITAWAHGRRR